jgi:hypothetical protein
MTRNTATKGLEVGQGLENDTARRSRRRVVLEGGTVSRKGMTEHAGPWWRGGTERLER